jgi:hypothetical protein
MKRKRIFTILVLVLLTCALSTTAFAIDESEVESAIAASSQEEVAGNVFIWFLCAIGFLKVSQKIDSFMASLSVNWRRPRATSAMSSTKPSMLRRVSARRSNGRTAL